MGSESSSLLNMIIADPSHMLSQLKECELGLSVFSIFEGGSENGELTWFSGGHDKSYFPQERSCIYIDPQPEIKRQTQVWI